MKRRTIIGKKFWALLLCACVLMSTLGVPTALAASTGSLTITKTAGGEPSASDYNYSGNVLTITSSTPMTISGTTTTGAIVVAGGITANITLDGVNIDVSARHSACAFNITGNSTANITLQGTNILKSGSNCAGIHVSAGNTVKINGSGSLAAQGHDFSAGIGSTGTVDCGTITINGGIVNANGGFKGAGIGGGSSGYSGGNGGTITINGGTVTATGTHDAKDIGPGDGGSDGTITITGGSVNPTRGRVSPRPTNGIDPVYLNTLTVGNPSLADDTVIAAIGYDSDKTYGYNDVVTDNDGKLYVWLPQNSSASAKVDVIGPESVTYTKTWARIGTAETQTLLRQANAIAPGITTQPTGGTYAKDSAATLTVGASVSDEGSPSYQWYSSITNSNTGGTPISGATAASYAPDTSALGTRYYYCIVTNTNPSVSGTQTATTTSNVAAVNVIDSPSVPNISAPAVSVGEQLSLIAPVINDNGDTVTAQGWEISTNGSTGWTTFDSATTMTYAHNGQYLRYYATNSVGSGYSNTVQITVNRLDLTLSLACENIAYGGTPDPQLTGNTGNGTETYEYKTQGAPDTDYATEVPAAAGNYTVRASVAATDTYNGGAVTANFSIEKATPGIILSAFPVIGSLADDTVTLTAVLTGVSASDFPNGNIIFKNGGTVLGTVALVNGEASYTWNHVPYGTHNLTAEYAGDTNYEDVSDTITGYDVQKRTQDALSITGVPENIVYGDDSFTLSTTGGSGNGTVTYTMQSGDAVSISGNIVTIEKAGTAVIQATKEADGIYNEISAMITVTVGKATPGISLTASPATGSLADDTVTLTATLTGVTPSDYPTGDIVFKNGNTILDTVALVNGEASYTWNNVPFGTHDIKAEYLGDANYRTTDDTITGFDVAKKMQASFSITGAPESVVYGDDSFTLNTTGGSGSGAVTYTVQSGDAVSVSGNTVTIEKAGTAVIQATKAADSIYNATSTTITVTVGKATPTLQANPSVNGANVGDTLSSLSLSELIAYGVNGTPLDGSFAWENPQTVLQAAGSFAAVFTPNDESYQTISFAVQVNLNTTEPVIASVQATPSINGAKLEVTASASTPLTYQWQVKGSWIDIPGATSAVFDYTGLSADTEYTVRVIVTDANGNSTTSEPITFKTGKQAVSGLPESCTIEKGKNISWTPSPAGGTWKYDSDYLSMSEKNGKATFTAKKVGKTTVSYTANGTEFVVSITINDSTIPQTGDTSNIFPYILLACGSLLGIGVLAFKRRKKEQ